tara:strand:- start:28 stop:492 length:465 start_codon:yes stop_codon:yes gene_type:complete
MDGHKHDYQKGSHNIKVKDSWSRASVSKNGVVYLTIYNHGNYSENLLSASASVAKKVQLHTHKTENGILRMRHLKSISIPPKSFLHLKPGGHHIMLIGLIKKLKNGNTFPLKLRFQKAGKVLVNVNIRHAGALGNHSHQHSLPTNKKHQKHQKH